MRGFYTRVIPRDLFNEASLLKCVGRVVILLDETDGHSAEVEQQGCGGFDVQQDDSDGSISAATLRLMVRGQRFDLCRPLNSREPWPLYVRLFDDPDFDEIAVFDDAGNFSPEMLRFLRGGA